MQRKEDTVLDKADNLTSGWLIEVKAFWWDLSCPNCSFFFSSGIARLCLMASTIEDSLRYWREYGMYINYFGNLWTKQTQHAFMDPDYFVAGCFLWPMILKIFPAILLCANILSDKWQKRMCYFFYFMGVYSMIGLQGYPGGRNWTLWQAQQLAKFCTAITLVYAEACSESNSMFAGLPSLTEKFTKKTYLALLGRILFGFLFTCKLQFYFHHWRAWLDWLVNVPCVLAIVVGYKTSFFTVLYTATLLFDNFYFHQFWLYWNSPFKYEHVVYSFMANMTVIGACLQWLIYGPGGISLDRLKSE